MVDYHMVAVRHTYFGSSVETRHYTRNSILALLPLPGYVLVNPDDIYQNEDPLVIIVGYRTPMLGRGW
jgi:hypothetical protein